MFSMQIVPNERAPSWGQDPASIEILHPAVLRHLMDRGTWETLGRRQIPLPCSKNLHLQKKENTSWPRRCWEVYGAKDWFLVLGVFFPNGNDSAGLCWWTLSFIWFHLPECKILETKSIQPSPEDSVKRRFQETKWMYFWCFPWKTVISLLIVTLFKPKAFQLRSENISVLTFFYKNKIL